MLLAVSSLVTTRFFAVVGLLLLIGYGQNCSKVELEQMTAELQTVQGVKTSFLKIPEVGQKHFRAIFTVDMSNSMFAGACPDSIDTLIPGVEASPNCVGPTGVDPDGVRFESILEWLNQTQAILDNQPEGSDLNVKVLVLAYSNLNFNAYWSLEGHIGLGGRANSSSPRLQNVVKDLGLENQIKPGFISIKDAQTLVKILWTAYAHYHKHPYPRFIERQIIEAVEQRYPQGANENASSGTSIILPTLQTLNLQMRQELEALKANNQRAHFEIVHVTDGVPKPFAAHIEAAVKLVWQSKDRALDDSLCGERKDGYCTGRVAVSGGQRCIERCGAYLKQYADSGFVQLPDLERPVCTSWYAMPQTCSGYSDGSTPNTRWGSGIKCGQCFEMLRQFDTDCQSTRNCMYGGDIFSQKVKQNWGDWTMNRHSEIIGQLRVTENLIIRNFNDSSVHMKFARINANGYDYSTPIGELVKEINWLERSRDIFGRKYHYFNLDSPKELPSLFRDLSPNPVYRIGAIYGYLQNLTPTQNGSFIKDSDGDGLADIQEDSHKRLIARSDNKCLDLIVKKYGSCVDIGCSFDVDADGDGLNQCEEKTLGTDDLLADTDGDSIIDSIELLFGLNPIEDDKKIFMTNDQLSNYDKFVRGFLPSVPSHQINTENSIQMQTALVGSVERLNQLNMSISVPEYKVEITNLPLIDLDPNSNQKANHFLVVVRIDDLKDPNRHVWMTKKFQISSPFEPIIVDLSKFENLGGSALWP